MALEKCSRCGLCKAACPVMAAEFDETIGPRGRAIQIKEAAFSDALFKCTLCRNCSLACPAGIDLAQEILKARGESGIHTWKNEEMIANVRKYGNVFGKPQGKPKDLQCC